MQQLNSQSDLEDEDADVETESVQKEDFFNWKLLLEEMLQFLTLIDPGNNK